jgi:hypothetical protein
MRKNFPFPFAFLAGVAEAKVSITHFNQLARTVMLVQHELSDERLRRLEEHAVQYNMFLNPCPICKGTGWKILHRQGDLVLPENIKELEPAILRGEMTLIPCYYAATTYVSCECTIIKTVSIPCGIPSRHGWT